MLESAQCSVTSVVSRIWLAGSEASVAFSYRALGSAVPTGRGVVPCPVYVHGRKGQLVVSRLASEAIAHLCGEFGISRKAVQKIFDRYQE